MKNTILFFLTMATVIFTSCEPEAPKTSVVETKPEAKPQVKIPKFDENRAFENVKKQVEFGPRVTNSPGHAACKKWLVETMEGYADNVIQQDFSAKAYTGTVLNGTNIIAQFNPKAAKRICIAAHWDTRHIADSDLCESDCRKPVDGADDGGSGVGILLEIARNLKEQPVSYGVDLVLFDAEDHGAEDDGNENKTDAEIMASVNSWGLGSQYWSKNLHTPGYNPKYAILLDMVGARNARFPKEELSRRVNPSLVNKIWDLGQKMGYTSYFVNENGTQVTDDHYFVNRDAGIRMIDIINLSPEAGRTFGDHWHTHNDNIENIEPRTLRAVGQVMLAVLYREENGTF